MFALAVSATVFVAEIVTGFLTNSLALLADSGHVFTDVTGVILALAAIELGRGRRTSGGATAITGSRSSRRS